QRFPEPVDRLAALKADADHHAAALGREAGVVGVRQLHAVELQVHLAAGRRLGVMTMAAALPDGGLGNIEAEPAVERQALVHVVDDEIDLIEPRPAHAWLSVPLPTRGTTSTAPPARSIAVRAHLGRRPAAV